MVLNTLYKWVIILPILFFTHNLFAQGGLIALQAGGKLTYYPRFDSAYAASLDGDTLYLPGRPVLLPDSLLLDKKLVIIGAGHRPDSSAATGHTTLTGGRIYLLTGASGGKLTGVELAHDLQVGSADTNAALKDYTIMRCNLKSIKLSPCDTDTCVTKATNIMLVENVIRGDIHCFQLPNAFISNNIVEGSISSLHEGSIIANSIFLNTSANDTVFSSIRGVLIQNNVFLGKNIETQNCRGNDYRNNIFTQKFELPAGAAGTDNQIEVTQDTLFITPLTEKYNYRLDYFPKVASPALQAGTDGNDIGITGGRFPAKPGNIPFNPHIRTAVVSNYVNPNGEIIVNIEVEAQNK